MDIGKIADVARMADIFISLDKAENNLNEDAINKYIQKSINVAGVTCSIEELAALKRNMQYENLLNYVQCSNLLRLRERRQLT